MNWSIAMTTEILFNSVLQQRRESLVCQRTLQEQENVCAVCDKICSLSAHLRILTLGDVKYGSNTSIRPLPD